MKIEERITEGIVSALAALYQLPNETITLQKTRAEFEGDCTFVVFPYTAKSKKSPEHTATDIGEFLLKHFPEIASYNVVKGFLNIVYAENVWIRFLQDASTNEEYGRFTNSTAKRIMLEYSSPNTNKPLHLGHIRNNLLGFSVARLLEEAGYQVIKANLINDRGIHICKSMLAWQKWGNAQTPEQAGMKGDKWVGHFYVLFDKHYKEEIAALMAKGMSKEVAEKEAPLMQEAQEMLRKWEAGDAAIRQLWKTMNEWVYAGFEKTYADLGVSFDAFYYESETYINGKKAVEEGLEKGVFYKKDDGSVWCDLTAEGLDHKLLLRADGTSVYITQDIGTAIQRFKQYPDLGKLIYTVGNEQDYHFNVLFLILQKLGYAQAKNCLHLSYGMVELPHGKMKSREGTVVDADDLIAEMIETAKTISEESGKTEGMLPDEKEKLYRMIGMGALKYYILKVDPKKKMLFNPQESIDFNGNTGPFIQYTHARICSILRKAGSMPSSFTPAALLPEERSLLRLLKTYPEVVLTASEHANPGEMGNYVYELCKVFNHFYQTIPILRETDEALKHQRLHICAFTAGVIKRSMYLLGIDVPERM